MENDTKNKKKSSTSKKSTTEVKKKSPSKTSATKSKKSGTKTSSATKAAPKRKTSATTKKTSTSKKSTATKKSSVSKTSTAVKKTSRIETPIIQKYYYMFKMNAVLLNVLSIILLIIVGFVFYFIYGNNSIEIFNDNIVLVMFLYVPYLTCHEIVHSISYCIYEADFKNITYGAYLEKSILCCLCKQNISKRNILHSLLAPFIYLGVITLIIGIVFDIPVLVILSLSNIAGCVGDFVMFYDLVKLNNYEFSEYNDPIAFGLYTKEDFSKLKLFGLKYVDKKIKLDRDDLKKIRISNTSIMLFIIFYVFLFLTLFVIE